MQKPAECTTILVGKDATIDGSTMIARSEDGGSTIIPEAFIAVNPKDQPKHYKAVISGQEIDDEDLLLAEYAATVIGVEILHERAAKVEEEVRKKAMVQIAFSTLSYSELEAIVNILGELKGMEGLLVASKIADRVGITRSVIVNALRKFESAGLIETKSLGMKGTYIRIKNEFLLEELRKNNY